MSDFIATFKIGTLCSNDLNVCNFREFVKTFVSIKGGGEMLGDVLKIYGARM